MEVGYGRKSSKTRKRKKKRKERKEKKGMVIVGVIKDLIVETGLVAGIGHEGEIVTQIVDMAMTVFETETGNVAVRVIMKIAAESEIMITAAIRSEVVGTMSVMTDMGRAMIRIEACEEDRVHSLHFLDVVALLMEVMATATAK